jgi:threonine aldolase
MVGGGMRQAGVLAAAGIYALQHHVERLREDHAKASRVAAALAELSLFRLRETPQTNMAMLAPDMDFERLEAFLAGQGIVISGGRWVFHLDVSDDDVDRLISCCRAYDAQYRAA